MVLTVATERRNPIAVLTSLDILMSGELRLRGFVDTMHTEER